MSTTLSPIKLVLDTATAVALTALGNDGTEEIFDLTPEVPCDRIVLIFDNLEESYALAVSIAAGEYWQASLGANAFTVTQATTKCLVLTGARHKDKDDNKILITLTPDSSASVSAELGAVMLPPAEMLTSV